ncbi:MAG: TetR/AcrR family transcriptional regulator [Methanoregula sp.]|jgi:AcrR family transcriptional regulator
MPRINADYREEAKRKILDAALDVARTNGWKSVTLEDIAGRVGVTKGALYAYFENRDALFRALILEVFTSFHRDLERIFSDDPDLPVMIDRLSELIFVSQNQYLSLFSQMPGHIANDPMLQEEFLGIYAKNSGLIQNQIARFQDTGKIPRRANPQDLARGLVGLAIGLRVTSVYLGRDAHEVKRIWINTVRLMFGMEPNET